MSRVSAVAIRQVAAATVAVVLALAPSASALPARALKGRTYAGKTATSYFDHEGEHSGGVVRALSLKVSSSGRTVTVAFAGGEPLFYCPAGAALVGQSTKPAVIAHTGAFKATVDEQLSPEPATALVEIVTGRFAGHTVKGTIKTEAGSCSGSVGFSATV